MTQPSDRVREVVVPVSLLEEAIDLIGCLRDDGECWFDHHGGCQEHGFLSLKEGEQCPHAQAPGTIEKLRALLPPSAQGQTKETTT